MIPCSAARFSIFARSASTQRVISTIYPLKHRAFPLSFQQQRTSPSPSPSSSHHRTPSISRTMAAIASSTSSEPVHILLLGVHMNAGEPFSEEALIKMIDGDVARGAEQGLTITYQLTRSAEPEYDLIIQRLRERAWDAVAVGAGVRFPKGRSALFEGLVNTVVRNAKPLPLLLFNSTPDGVVEAYFRAKGEMERVEKTG